MTDSNEVVLVYSHGAGQNVLVDRLPEVGETMRARAWYLDRDGGKGTNIAVALGRLGVKNSLITRVGDDAWATLCTGWLVEAGVDTSFVCRDSNVETCTGVVFIDPEGRNSIVLSDTDFSVPHDLIDNGLEANRGAKLFVTGFEIEAKDALYAMKKAKALGLFTLVNPSPAPDDFIPDFVDADVVILNEIELHQLLSYSKIETSEDIAEASSCFRKFFHCRSVIVTFGEKGWLLNNEGRISSAPGLKTTVIDTSGAGDGFLAAVVYRLSLGETLEEACCWANYYAAVTVGYSGTIPGYLSIDKISSEIQKIKDIQEA